ncbi:hypothetical protein CCACVL1_23050, partial [Corchorus capsularis]
MLKAQNALGIRKPPYLGSMLLAAAHSIPRPNNVQ